MLIPFLKSGGKYRIIDSESLSLVGYSEYDYLDFFYEGLARARIKNNWMYINAEDFSIELNHKYDEITPFENGIAAVKRSGLWRFINKNGIEISTRGYNNYRWLSNKLILTSSYSGGEIGGYTEYRGLMDYTGFEIIPADREQIIEINDELIIVNTTNGYWGLDFNGIEYFNTARYSFISSFHQERAIAILKKSGEVFIVDKYLNKIKSLGIRHANELSETYTLNSKNESGFINGVFALKFDEKWGYINIEGEIVCKPQYDILFPIWNGFAVAGKRINAKMKFTFLNANFEEIIPFKYDGIGFFSDGYASMELNGKWGVIRSDGTEIIPPQYSQIGEYAEGKIWVSWGDYEEGNYFGKYGFYDFTGRKICPIIYDWVKNFEFGFAIVELNNKYGLLNQEGKVVKGIRYDNVISSCRQFLYVEKGGEQFVVDPIGNEFCEELMEPKDKFPF